MCFIQFIDVVRISLFYLFQIVLSPFLSPNSHSAVCVADCRKHEATQWEQTYREQFKLASFGTGSEALALVIVHLLIWIYS